MHKHRLMGGVIVVVLAVAQTLLADPTPALNQTTAFDPDWKIIPIASGICPQNRTTRNAPSRYVTKKNLLSDFSENIEAGKQLYYKDAKPTACSLCHGIRGNGNGRLARGLNPPPRNFTCAELMDTISDGQLFWVIKNGSRGTAMPIHRETLTDKQIWQLILFIRQFAH